MQLAGWPTNSKSELMLRMVNIQVKWVHVKWTLAEPQKQWNGIAVPPAKWVNYVASVLLLLLQERELKSGIGYQLFDSFPLERWPVGLLAWPAAPNWNRRAVLDIIWFDFDSCSRGSGLIIVLWFVLGRQVLLRTSFVWCACCLRINIAHTPREPLLMPAAVPKGNQASQVGEMQLPRPLPYPLPRCLTNEQ